MNFQDVCVCARVYLCVSVSVRACVRGWVGGGGCSLGQARELHQGLADQVQGGWLRVNALGEAKLQSRASVSIVGSE